MYIKKYTQSIYLFSTFKMAKFSFRGLMAPVLAPFNKNFTLNLDVIPKYAKFLYENGIHGVLVNGTTGEGMSLSVPERKLLAETWVRTTKESKAHVMVQVGGAPLPYVLELAQQAEQIGANSILCLPELYYKPKTTSDLIQYLKHVSNAAPNTPLLYYNFPVQTGVYINMEQFLNDAADQIPTLVGIKHTSLDLVEGISAVKACDGKYAVFLGNNQLLAGAFAMGINSGIITSLNMFPQLGTKILKLSQQNNAEEARKVQDLLTKACSAVNKYGAWVPTMKQAMRLCTPIDVGLAKPPLQNIKDEHVKQMERGLEALNLLRR